MMSDLPSSIFAFDRTAAAGQLDQTTDYALGRRMIPTVVVAQPSEDQIDLSRIRLVDEVIRLRRLQCPILDPLQKSQRFPFFILKCHIRSLERTLA
ncbi:MAG: hypothetical protein JXA30_11060 [Deltaproteobacteria bacterium]|nr:hypothetical protein [Deltaproteobacteria bacterium]